MQRHTFAKLDSAQSVFFSRELESIDQTPYETAFAGRLGRRYIPLVEGVAEWENVYTYRMWTRTGRARVHGPNAKALSRVGVFAQETSRNIKEIALMYGWTVREIQQAAQKGVPLDRMTVMSAQASAAQQVDDLLAIGDSTLGIEGLYNITGVSLSTASTKSGTGAGTAWIRTVPVTPSEILADINKIVSDTRAALKQAGDATPGIPAFQRFTLLIPSAQYSYIAGTPRSDNSDTTILKYALQNNPWIESIEEWWQGKGVGGSGSDRMVCYPRDPMAVGALVPQEFTALPPQESGLDINIPATMTCGGTICRYPVAMRYMDAI